MFTTGWAAPRRRSACRTADVLALKSHNLDATIFLVPRPKLRRPCPSGIANSASLSSLTEGTPALDVAAVGVQGRGAASRHPTAPFSAPPVTCRVCPSAFSRRSASWTTIGPVLRRYFSAPHIGQACQPRPRLDPGAKGCIPLDPQRFSAASERCCNCRGVPDLATGKNRSVT